MANPKALETKEPFGLRMVTVRELAMALALMASLTFSCVGLTKVVVIVMSPPLSETVDPCSKPEPVMTVLTVVPRLPNEGTMELITGFEDGGGGGVIVTVCAVVVLTPPLPSLTVSAIRCVPIGNLTLATAVVAMTMP